MPFESGKSRDVTIAPFAAKYLAANGWMSVAEKVVGLTAEDSPVGTLLALLGETMSLLLPDLHAASLSPDDPFAPNTSKIQHDMSHIRSLDLQRALQSADPSATLSALGIGWKATYLPRTFIGVLRSDRYNTYGFAKSEISEEIIPCKFPLDNDIRKFYYASKVQ